MKPEGDATVALSSSTASAHGIPERRRTRATKAERQEQIAEVTTKLVARYGVHGTIISRVAAGTGLSWLPSTAYANGRDVRGSFGPLGCLCSNPSLVPGSSSPRPAAQAS